MIDFIQEFVNRDNLYSLLVLFVMVFSTWMIVPDTLSIRFEKYQHMYYPESYLCGALYMFILFIYSYIMYGSYGTGLFIMHMTKLLSILSL